MTRPRVKVCCISSIEEAKAAMDAGASALGLVGQMPSGPGVISDELIHRIARAVPPPVSTFLLTSETRATDIIRHYKKVYTSVIQLVDKPEAGAYEALRRELPYVKLVQVLHVSGHNSLTEATEAAAFVDALLLDSGNPGLPVKVLGGTGRTHNWEISREITRSVTVPVFLAGGLHSGNVKQAIEAVQPYGLDLCNGVRTNGKLDAVKLKAFFEAIDS
jgi:phosphoribosylanthranilate isomerase